MKRHASRRWWAAGVVVLALAAAAGGWSLYRQYKEVSGIPVVTVSRGVFVDEVKLRGDIRPLRTLTVNAPMSASSAGDLRIVKLVRTGIPSRRAS